MAENKPPVPNIPQQAQLQRQAIPEEVEAQKLQRLTIKFNAAMTLNQEIGEAVSDYINASNNVKADLRKQIADLQKSIAEKKPKKEEAKGAPAKKEESKPQ
jgi:hypothetical protein